MMTKTIKRNVLPLVFGLLLALLLCPCACINIQATDNITVCLSVEKFTISQGYLVEPTLVTVPESTTCAQAITDLFGNGNYQCTGTIANGFYLSVVKDNSNSVINVPMYILTKIAQDNDTIDKRFSSWLGEFDYTFMSGWIYSANNTLEQIRKY